MTTTDVVASTLAPAADLDWVEELLMGRPNPWEASLICGSSGHDIPGQLIRHRSRPVVVCLNVAELVDRAAAPGHGPYRDKTDALDALAVDADEDELDALNDQAIQLHQHWQARYTDYAAGFTAAVHQVAAELGVPVPVRVQANTDPDDPCGRPGNSGQPWADEWIDPLACLLYTSPLSLIHI